MQAPQVAHAQGKGASRAVEGLLAAANATSLVLVDSAAACITVSMQSLFLMTSPVHGAMST